MSRLHQKSAIITGAASGIGAGTAEVFAEQGARLMLVDRDEAGLEAVRMRLAADDAEVAVFCGDVSDRAVIAGVVDGTLAKYGRIDIIFNNAGIMPHGDLREFDEDTWDAVLDVNLKSMFLMAKAAIRHMLERGSGSIINTSSVMASLTEPGYEAYSASKAGIIGLTKAIAVSYAAQGIRCNCICPGWVDTPMNRQLVDQLGGLEALNIVIRRQQPQARMASTREVANAVLFLASDEASAVTGSALYVDGAASAAI
jgi:NAD(P)-dependent dehydrogenase (short-subunit alcohol dehydrogenase family)